MAPAAPTNPADLSVVEASALLAARALSSAELVDACLQRIEERDGEHSFDGDPASINAFARVYADDARAAAARADERLSAAAVRRDGAPPLLCGIPIALKDLYAVAGKPLTASSRALDDMPSHDCDAWARLSARGMVLIGHVHTHEFALGGTTDQVGNPWALERTPGGSSGGSAAALAARLIPAATGTDTAGSLRIPSAACGTSSIKATRGRVSLRGVVPLSVSLDHAGPMARTVADCALLLVAMAGPDPGRAESALAADLRAVDPAPTAGGQPLAGLRLAVSPRIAAVDVEPDVTDGFDAALEACRRLGASIVSVPAIGAPLSIDSDFFDVLIGELPAYHRRFDDRRELYRPFLREWMEIVERRALPAHEYVEAQGRRREVTALWAAWFAAERIDAVIEPTLPIVAPPRGTGYEHPFQDNALISLTHYWNWTGFPAVALPAGVGARSGLPVSVSLVGPAGREAELLRAGIDLQAELGLPELPVPSTPTP